MARALIVGCGCHGRELGVALAGQGWLVRGTSRAESGLEPIQARGLEASLADPDAPGTVLDLVGDVTAVVWLLGSAVGDPDLVAAIHGPRLEALLARLVDTPVRGFAYEAAGSAPARDLAAGREIVVAAARSWRIPVTMLDRARDEPGWAEASASAVAGLVGA